YPADRARPDRQARPDPPRRAAACARGRGCSDHRKRAGEATVAAHSPGRPRVAGGASGSPDDHRTRGDVPEPVPGRPPRAARACLPADHALVRAVSRRGTSRRISGRLARRCAAGSRRRASAGARRVGRREAEQWITLDQLVERLKRRAYELLFRRQWHHYSNPYRDSSSNPLNWTFAPTLDEERGWDQVEGGLIRVVIGQTLHWLGVVDLGQAGTGCTA